MIPLLILLDTFKLTIAVDSVIGVPRVTGSGSTLGNGGLSPIPIVRPGYRVMVGQKCPTVFSCFAFSGDTELRPTRSNELTRLALVQTVECSPIQAYTCYRLIERAREGQHEGAMRACHPSPVLLSTECIVANVLPAVIYRDGQRYRRSRSPFLSRRWYANLAPFFLSFKILHYPCQP